MDWIFVIVRAIPLYTTFYIVSIHLMLLFIIKMQLKKVIEYYGFNTSHITLYQIWESSCNRNTNVSIHLMLLFIGFHWRTVCCKQTVSIHLMLLFIFCCWFLWLHIKFVSIHLMLLFIKLHKTL